jgi:hypothetical protein
LSTARRSIGRASGPRHPTRRPPHTLAYLRVLAEITALMDFGA